MGWWWNGVLLTSKWVRRILELLQTRHENVFRSRSATSQPWLCHVVVNLQWSLWVSLFALAFWGVRT
jgi:hypothetical protein